MTRINLLPWREARRKQQQRHFMSMLAIAAVVAVMGVLLAHLQITDRLEHQETRNQYLRSEIEQLKKVAAEIKQMDETKGRLLGRLEIIQNLQHKRPGMVYALDALVRHLPEEIYLTSLKSEGNQLVLKGTASSNNVLSDFMRELEKSPWFGEPILKVIENKEVNSIRASEFELAVARKIQLTDHQDDEELQ